MTRTSQSFASKPYLRAVAGLDQRKAPSGQSIAILLSVYQDEACLNQKLDSFIAQTDTYWRLYWRDDGSTDASRAIMLAFQDNRGQGRCKEVTTLSGHIGIARSYAQLLDAVPKNTLVAYANKDDLWLPENLSRGRAALADVQGPTLYCARQCLTDERLSVTDPSLSVRYEIDFRKGLSQNLTTDHTLLLNTAAVQLAKATPPPENIPHDWWICLLVLCCGGTTLFDPCYSSFHRKHRRSAMKAERTVIGRGMYALRNGPDAFTAPLAIITDALEHPSLHTVVTPAVRGFIKQLRVAQAGSVWTRTQFLLTERSFTCQTSGKAWIFRLWFLLHRKSRPLD